MCSWAGAGQVLGQRTWLGRTGGRAMGTAGPGSKYPPVDKSRETGSEQRGWVWVPAEAGAQQLAGACRSSWPLLLDSDLAELVCLVSWAWPPAPPPLPPAGRPRGEMRAVLPGWVSLGTSCKTGKWALRTCDISNSLGIGQRKQRAQGPRRHPGSPISWRSIEI